MKYNRMIKLQRSDDPAVRALTTTTWFEKEFRKWTPSQHVVDDGWPMDIRQNRDTKYSLELNSTADGYGLEFAGRVPYANRWCIDGNLVMSGHRYCAAIALRAGVLYSRARAARGIPGKQSHCDCCGPGVTEYLGHIIQVCGRTHGPRIHRHDLLRQKIARMLGHKGWTVVQERRIDIPGSTFCQPDLLAWTEERSLVLDVAVCSDSQDPDIAHQLKVDKYGQIDAVQTEMAR